MCTLDCISDYYNLELIIKVLTPIVFAGDYLTFLCAVDLHTHDLLMMQLVV